MGFSSKALKNLLKTTGFLCLLPFSLPCESLESTKSSLRQKNTDFKRKALNPTLQDSPIIDKNYFEIQADIAYLKGEEAFFKRDTTKALRHFKKALLFAPHSLHLQKRLAEIYEQEGLFAEALRLYKKLSKAGVNHKSLHQKISSIYSLAGLNKKALENYQALLKKEPNNFSLWLEKALLLIKQENWPEALKSLRTAEEKASRPEEQVQVILSQSYIFASLQDFPKSLKNMKKLAGLPIYREDLILQISDFYKSLGQNALAIHSLESFQNRQGLTKWVSKSLLDLYISSADWKKALQQIERAQALGYFEEQHYFYMALLLIEKKNYDRALIFLKDLVTKNPKQGQYLYFLALTFERKKEWRKALKFYNQVSESSPMFLLAKLQVSQALKHIGRAKESFSLLEKLAFPKEEGLSLQALLLYAESLWDSGHRKKALHVLTKGLNQQPFHTELLFLRGLYFKESGQTELALKDINDLLRKKADHEEALNFMASLYSEQKINLNEAEKMAHKALQLRPNSSSFLSTLGWILFQKGELKSALLYLNKAFSKNNKDSHIAKQLGKVHLKLKNFEKSEYFFKEALKLEENDKKLKKSPSILVHKQAFIP